METKFLTLLTCPRDVFICYKTHQEQDKQSVARLSFSPLELQVQIQAAWVS